MIEFIKNCDKALWIKLTPGGSLGKDPIWAVRECTSELECQLLQDYLKRAMATQLEEIRRVSYERGWQDAKSKKRGKSTTFATCMTVLEWERQ